VTTKHNPALHRFAFFTACATFCLVIAGGLVTSTGSGLAVPDWPLSYGQVMPPMVGGIFYEHGHRMVATFVGLLTTILALWLWRADERRWVRVLGFAALGAVITQGVLGGLTVLFLLPTPVSVAHATLAQSFFSLTVFLALVTSRLWMEGAPEPLPAAGKTRLLILAAAGAVFLQLVLGAWMRHSDAGLAIPDFPLSYGRLVPPGGSGGLSWINEQRLDDYDLPPVVASQVWIHFAHRAGALLAGIVVLACGFHVLRTHRDDRRLREPAIVMIMLVLVQILLGALTVWTGKGVQIATAHVATGALLFGTCVFTAARSFHHYALAAAVAPVARSVAPRSVAPSSAAPQSSVSPQPTRT
jgi:cytochrome c oxidase assembly protein subunit 15